MYSKKFNKWLIDLYGLAMAGRVTLKNDDYYIGWYNAGYTPKDIIDNLDHINNPGHP